ncbi:MAG: effector binding domain-containing protein [Oscillospiraceae bacterium]|nr:effector binding domain-containing protein [Oscillospiraceae bacterium]
MENLTISQVSKSFGVTPRMLRHYEKMGLIAPTYKEDYAYRTYDEKTVRRLQQIVILRKLRISLKDISVILDDSKYTATLEILRRSISELDEEINALDVIRGIIKGFAERLEENRLKADFHLLEDKQLIELSETLSISRNTLKEEHSAMNDLNNANESLIKQLPVRIVMLPPFTVASNHVIGKEPEATVGDEMDKFIREKKLYEIKPDSRYFGFNHQNPGRLPNDEHGYEVWATIPEDMEVPPPLTKKHFDGRLFAALTIKFPDFYRWGELESWVKESTEYDLNYNEELGFEIMGGCLEEHLNWVYSSHMGWPENGVDGQLDLLMPIKKR